MVNDPAVELELLYIDDLLEEMISALKGEEHRCMFDGWIRSWNQRVVIVQLRSHIK